MKQLIVSIPVDLPTLDIGKLFVQQQLIVLQSLYQHLVRVDESNQIVGDIAKRWEVSDAGRVFTFELGPSKFSDGTQVLAEDVAFSLYRQLWPNSGSFGAGYIRDIVRGASGLKQGDIPAGIQVIAPNKVRVTLNQAYPPFLYVLSMPSFSIISKRAFQHGTLVGSGPMVADAPSSGKLMMLRSKYYAGTRPATEAIEVRTGLSNASAVDLMLKGHLDVAFLSGNQDEQLVGKVGGDYGLTQANILTYNHLFSNTDHPLLSNSAFRKDLSTLIQGVAGKTKALGRFQVYEPYFFPKGVMPPSYYHRAVREVSTSEFRKKWAAQMRGKLPLRLRFPESFTSAEFRGELTAALHLAGIPSHVSSYSRSELVNIAKTHDFDLLCAAYSGNFPDPDGFLDAFTGNSGFSYAHFDAAPLRDEILRIKFIPDALSRLDAYGAIVRRYEEDGFVIPLFREHISILHNSRLRIPEMSFRYESEISNIAWR